jgi:hypothetical protein
LNGATSVIDRAAYVAGNGSGIIANTRIIAWGSKSRGQTNLPLGLSNMRFLLI